MSDRSFPPGAKVWAKFKGYPWWPGTVVRLADIPKKLIDSSKSLLTKENIFPILFFGSNDYALIPLDSIKNLNEDWEVLSSKNGTHQFRLAIAEASKFVAKPPGKTFPQLNKPVGAKISTSENPKHLSAASNPLITIDPFTGEQSTKKKRGRPPKKKLDVANHAASVNKEEFERPSSQGNSKPSRLLSNKELGVYCKKLQKILLRSELKEIEMPIAVHIINTLFKKQRCTIEQLKSSSIGKVLAHAMQRDYSVWEKHSDIVESFNFVLKSWKTLPFGNTK